MRVLRAGKEEAEEIGRADGEEVVGVGRVEVLENDDGGRDESGSNGSANGTEPERGRSEGDEPWNASRGRNVLADLIMDLLEHRTLLP